MGGAHLHLLFTHIPVIAVPLGLLVVAYAWLGRRTEAARIGMGIFVLGAVAAIGVYLTGEAAEEAVEGLPGISDAIIERHEAAALIAVLATAILGLFSLLGLLFTRGQVPQGVSGLALVIALVVSGILGWTANLGGQINHPELRSSPTAAPAGDGAAGSEEAGEDDD